MYITTITTNNNNNAHVFALYFFAHFCSFLCQSDLVTYGHCNAMCTRGLVGEYFHQQVRKLWPRVTFTSSLGTILSRLPVNNTDLYRRAMACPEYAKYHALHGFLQDCSPIFLACGFVFFFRLYAYYSYGNCVVRPFVCLSVTARYRFQPR